MLSRPLVGPSGIGLRRIIPTGLRAFFAVSICCFAVASLVIGCFSCGYNRSAAELLLPEGYELVGKGGYLVGGQSLGGFAYELGVGHGSEPRRFALGGRPGHAL